MTLLEKINSIDLPKIKSFSPGYALDIATFYKTFIEPKLPGKELILQWNSLLINYSNLPNAVFPVRAFYSRNKKSIEGFEDDELRRGFYTKYSNADFSIFFTDIFFAAYIEKMLLDNYCPTLEEFKELIISRQFPARFGKHSEYEKIKAAYKIDAKNPGINSAGYRIAHIVDTGKYYSVDGESSLNTLAEKYDFGRGVYSDWKEESDLYGPLYIRKLKASNPAKTKEILKAHFLRFTNPLNYVLTPKSPIDNKVYNEFYNSAGEKEHDIAEYKNLQNYVHEQFETYFGKQYTDYLNQIYLPNNYFNKSDGTERIRIYYGNPLSKQDFIIPDKPAPVFPGPRDKLPWGALYDENEITICTYIARFGENMNISQYTVYKIHERSLGSIKMKIQNIVALLDKKNISRSPSFKPLYGSINQPYARNNWDIIGPLCELSKEELSKKCLHIIKKLKL